MALHTLLAVFSEECLRLPDWSGGSLRERGGIRPPDVRVNKRFKRACLESALGDMALVPFLRDFLHAALLACSWTVRLRWPWRVIDLQLVCACRAGPTSRSSWLTWCCADVRSRSTRKFWEQYGAPLPKHILRMLEMMRTVCSWD